MLQQPVHCCDACIWNYIWINVYMGFIYQFVVIQIILRSVVRHEKWDLWTTHSSIKFNDHYVRVVPHLFVTIEIEDLINSLVWYQTIYPTICLTAAPSSLETCEAKKYASNRSLTLPYAIYYGISNGYLANIGTSQIIVELQRAITYYEPLTIT